MMSGRFEMCCSPMSADQYPALRSVLTMCSRLVAQPEAAVREPHQPVGVPVLAGEQAAAASRACRHRAEGLAEQHALVCEVLDVGRRDGLAVGLHVAPGVVGVEVEDVR